MLIVLLILTLIIRTVIQCKDERIYFKEGIFVVSKILQNIGFIKKNLPLLCFFCFTFPVFAQGDASFTSNDIIGLDVSFQIGAIRTPEEFGSSMVGFGVRGGYYLGSIVFIDGEIFHEPKNLLVEGRSRTMALGGLRVGTIFDDMIGVFAKTRAGIINFGTNSVWQAELENSISTVIDIGIIIERYYERKFFLRFDIGDYIIPLGNAKAYDIYGEDYRMGTRHNFAVEFGFGFRF